MENLKEELNTKSLNAIMINRPKTVAKAIALSWRLVLGGWKAEGVGGYLVLKR